MSAAKLLLPFALFIASPVLEHFQAKWTPVRRPKML
jgi:hypothetical protein